MNDFPQEYGLLEKMYGWMAFQPKTIAALGIAAATALTIPLWLRMQDVAIGEFCVLPSRVEVGLEIDLKDAPLYVRPQDGMGRFVLPSGRIYEKGGKKEGGRRLVFLLDEGGRISAGDDAAGVDVESAQRLDPSLLDELIERVKDAANGVRGKN